MFTFELPLGAGDTKKPLLGVQGEAGGEGELLVQGDIYQFVQLVRRKKRHVEYLAVVGQVAHGQPHRQGRFGVEIKVIFEADGRNVLGGLDLDGNDVVIGLHDEIYLVGGLRPIVGLAVKLPKNALQNKVLRERALELAEQPVALGKRRVT